MSEPLEPLSSELDMLLQAERRAPDPGPEVEQQVFSRLWGTLLPTGGSPWASGEEAAGTGGGGLATTRPGHQTPAGSAATPMVAVSGAPSVVAGLGLARMVITLLVGTVAGAGIHSMLDKRAVDHRPPVASGPAPAVPQSPPAWVAPPPPEPPPAMGESARQHRVAAPRSAPPAPAIRPAEPQRVPALERDRGLAAERTLIEQARTALTRGKGETALLVLERHGRSFPAGALIEERESLLVQALVQLERYEEARQAAGKFHQRFPRSIFGAVVDESLGSIP